MGRKLTIVLAAALALAGVYSVLVRTSSAPAEQPASTLSSSGEDTPTGYMLVDLADDADGADRAEVIEQLNDAIAPFDWPDDETALGTLLNEDAQLYRVRVPASERADVIEDLSDDSDVDVVEVERMWRLPESEMARLDSAEASSDVDSERGRFAPNDPYYKHQWHLDQIQMPEAWAMEQGAGVVVAVIDSGVAYRDSGAHKQAPDLAGTNFVPGRSFAGGDGPDDSHGHGTHVAGTIAQSTNNGVGVAGVAPRASIMPIRVLNERGAGGWGAVASGIRWAADNGADVINMSLGGAMPSRAVASAVKYAHGKGVVVVAAAGNSSQSKVHYPAAHDHVIAVGAVRFDEKLSFYSCYGRGLDIVAPGGDLRVDQNRDGLPDGVLQNTMVRGNPGRHDYLAFQGTSMAAPHIAGVAALLKGAGVTDPDAVERILMSSAKKKSDTQKYASGLVQAADAIKAAKSNAGGAKGLAAALFGFMALIGLSRRRELNLSLGKTIAIAAVIGGGLAIVPWHLLGASMLGDVSLGLGGLLGMAGDWGALGLTSFLVPGFLVVAGMSNKTLRPLAIGAAFAFVGVFAVEALWPTLKIAALPAWLVGPWLLVNAVITAWIAKLASKKS